MAVPTILIVVLAIVAILQLSMRWPGSQSESFILGGALLLSLLPVGLRVIDMTVMRGGSIAYGSLKLDFASTVRQMPSVTIPTNIGVPGIPIPDSGSSQILDTFRFAMASDIVVIDLESGQAWWETRLLVLCAGATRLGRPAAIVFVAIDKGAPGHFEGWGIPGELLNVLLQSNPEYRKSYLSARSAASQWQMVTPPFGLEPPAPPTWLDGLARAHPWIGYPTGEPNELAAEQYLAADLARFEPPATGMTAVRVRALFAGVLRMEAVDKGWAAERRVEAVLESDGDYLALTDHGRYLGMMSRASAQNAILSALVSGGSDDVHDTTAS